MAKTPELRLVSTILSAGSFREAEAVGVQQSMFLDPTAHALFGYIANYAAGSEVYGALPAPDELLDLDPDLELPKPMTSVESALEPVRKQHLRVSLQDAIDNVGLDIVTDPAAAVRGLNEATELMLTEAACGGGNTITSIRDYSFIEDAKRLDEVGFEGYKFPWPSLNKGYQGIIPGLWVLSCTPKGGKTWLSLFVVNWLATQYPDMKILVWHAEGRTKDLYNRVYQLQAGLEAVTKPWSKFTDEEKDRVREAERFYRDDNKDRILWTGNRVDLIGPTAIRKAYDDVKPDFLFVDSGYISAGDLEWKNLLSFQDHMQRFASDWEIPIWATMQDDISASEEADKRSGRRLAFAKMQVAALDVQIRAIPRMNNRTGLAERELVFPYTRHKLPVEGLTVAFQPAVSFEEVYGSAMSDEEQNIAQAAPTNSKVIQFRERLDRMKRERPQP